MIDTGAAKDSRYVKNAGAVFNLSYHMVGCPKYRRKVLVGGVEQRLKHVLFATAQQYGVRIETMEVMPDHVHLFVSSETQQGAWRKSSTA